MLMYMPSPTRARFAAVVPARMFQRMGRSLREARDLGSYELEERLGEGGMGEVWRARHRLLARPAAIKLVRPEMLGAGGASDSRLARAALRVRGAGHRGAHLAAHDSAVRLRRHRRRPLLLRDGAARRAATWRRSSTSSAPLPVPRVLFLLQPGLPLAGRGARRGLVHRDIKPANIFVCRMGLDRRRGEGARLRPGASDRRRDPALEHLTKSLAALERRRRHAGLHGARE